MNPIAALQKELEALYKKHELVRAYMSGYGTTSWTMLDSEEKAAKHRARAILREMRTLRKHAGLRHKTSSVAHGGRR